MLVITMAWHGVHCNFPCILCQGRASFASTALATHAIHELQRAHYACMLEYWSVTQHLHTIMRDHKQQSRLGSMVR